MKRCAAALVVSLAALVAPLGAQGGQPLVVRASATPCLTLRAAPRSDAAPLACLLPGTAVTADSAVPFWRRILSPGGTRGWSAKKFLDIKGRRMAYIDEGEGDAIVFQHGTLCRTSNTF